MTHEGTLKLCRQSCGDGWKKEEMLYLCARFSLTHYTVHFDTHIKVKLAFIFPVNKISQDPYLDNPVFVYSL